MNHGGARKGAGRKRMPCEAKRVPIAMRVSPACNDWLRDKAMEYDLSLGEMVEQMMHLWREQERKYYGVDDTDEPYIKNFCTVFQKGIEASLQDFKNLPLSDKMTVAEEMEKIVRDMRK